MASPAIDATVRTEYRATAARAGLASLALFSLAHFFIDLYSSALGAFQPLLGEKLGLSLTQAGLLGGLMVFSSSVVQPAYGYLSDRFRTRMFSVLAPAVAAIFISSLGLVSNVWWLAAFVFLGGSGIASFHPQASAQATLGITVNRGRWMAVFISAGTLGLALGPSYYSAVFHRLGLPGSYWAAAPGVAVTLALLWWMPKLPASFARSRARFDWEPLRAVWKPLTVLYFLVFIRSTIQIVFTQLLPLYLHRERGFGLAEASYALSLYLASGAVGGFVGGHLADRFGGRRVIFASMAGSLPFLALFFLAGGPLAMVGLGLTGLVLLFTVPVNVVMAQDLVPSQVGTVSALMMGFSWGMAGLIFIPLTGLMGDYFTLHRALAALCIFPVLGAFLALKLPK